MEEVPGEWKTRYVVTETAKSIWFCSWMVAAAAVPDVPAAVGHYEPSDPEVVVT